MEKSEKRKRFERLATKRTRAVLDKLDILANCANTANYEYTEDDVKKIFDAIEGEVKNVKTEFTSKMKKENQGEFTL